MKSGTMKSSGSRLILFTCAVILVFSGVVIFGAAQPTAEQRLAEARNLGKAFYENPTTGAEAVAEFKKALDLDPKSNREKLNYALALLKQGDADRAIALLQEVQKLDPSLPHTWFNLGIYHRKNGDAEKAIVQFRAMLRLTPNEPVAHYQLGALLRQQGNAPAAIAEFERTEQLNPLLAGGHFQLYNLYRQAGRAPDAARELAKFQDLKKQQEGSPIPEDLDWCNYAEIYDPPPAAPAATPAVRAPSYDDQTLPGTLDPKTAGLLLIDSGGKGQIDLLAWSSRGAALYRRGTTLADDSGLESLRNVIHIAQGDFDNDGLMDLCVLTTTGPVLYRNIGGKFARVDAALPQRPFVRAVWLDYDHDNDLDLLLLGDSPALIRNEGKAGFADKTADFPFVPGHVADAWKLRSVPDTKSFDLAVLYSDRKPVLYRDDLGGKYETAAFDGNPRNLTGAEDDFAASGNPVRVRVAPDGSLHAMHNRTPSSHHWIRVQLAGIRSLKLAQDAEVEVKAGTLYRKQLYEGMPLLFDTGDYETIDVVRITWPNGLIQNETRQPADKTYRYEESQRLSGSCPMIWTWNGSEFEFITDVLGVAPLGAADGDGAYFPVNHVEHISIPGKALRPVNGRFDIRLTEELSEVTYLDQVQLYAVDHPAGTEVFTNDKFQSPPFPPLSFYQSSRRIYPVAAHDDKGADVLARVLKSDGLAPNTFERTALGVAGMHTLELDFGKVAPDGVATLLLNGWVDWADGSVFRAAAQEGGPGLVMPYLQMQDASGAWQTVNQDMGLPSGKPKTIAVDLKFPASSRKIRIVTNLCIYWDEIFLSEATGAPAVRRQPIPLISADLHFRGFSKSHIDPSRLKPDTYEYAQVSSDSFWNPTPGFYTRYGAVRELVSGVDDQLVIMGSGDEVTLGFSPATLAPPPPGSVRDYLFEVDGWAKDSDPNTAFSSTVEPLPFHGMSAYPYQAREHYPADEVHNTYRRKYNTRPALRLIRPLSE
jgi:tetratricopeptide (TPR) repeat protein